MLSKYLMLSLKEICLRRLAVILCSRTHILASFMSSCTRTYIEKNQDIINLLRNDIEKLKLPLLLTEKMHYTVKCIVFEIRDWEIFHKNYLDFFSYYGISDVILQQLVWTTLGIVDLKKTAENIIRQEFYPILCNYELSCLYCLEDYIPVLMEKVPEEFKNHTHDITKQSTDKRYLLRVCWPFILKGEETKLNDLFEKPPGNIITFNQSAFEYFAFIGNKAAAEYFFRNLENDERANSLFRVAKTILTDEIYIHTMEKFIPNSRIDTFLFLLSHMSSEEQMEILKENPVKALKFFLDFPWQHLFSVVLDNVWTFLTADDYASLLYTICPRIRDKYFDYAKVFQKVLLHGSVDFRRHFVDQECQYAYCFRIFFDYQDVESVRFIFRAIDSVDRKRLLISGHFLTLLYYSLSKERYHFLELCLKEANLSIEDKVELEKKFYDSLTVNNIFRVEMLNVSLLLDLEKVWVEFLHILYVGKEAISKNRQLYEYNLFND